MPPFVVYKKQIMVQKVINRLNHMKGFLLFDIKNVKRQAKDLYFSLIKHSFFFLKILSVDQI